MGVLIGGAQLEEDDEVGRGLVDGQLGTLDQLPVEQLKDCLMVDDPLADEAAPKLGGSTEECQVGHKDDRVRYLAPLDV